ncbi:UBX domain-containing 11 isoform X1 [Pelobates cultripes]|uniref:UBX domain-containing protein 11 n=2 Tax=Pelobates cultripes TaxID=61616 RepID=A0AAD1R1E1_PELCU|nr:UBX domain-containing 11 isoform X1 [Pelobates cultripes]
MSGPLVTLGRPRKTCLIPINRKQHGEMDEMSSGARTHIGGDMSNRQIIPEKQLTAVDLPRIGRRAAPFKDQFPYTGSVPSDFDLLSATMKRVTELERCVHIQERTLLKKDQEIAALEEKIKKLQNNKIDSSLQVSQELGIKCQKLQQRVQEMEQFLKDYGLVWVGDDDSSSSSKPDTRTWTSGHSSSTFQPDFDLILQNLQDLNILGGEGKSCIEYRDGGARLISPKPVQLTLYSNGIIMFNGPFRSYQEASTKQCLQDIMDGYFPAELQSRFPDGIPFQVTDKRNVVFREHHSWEEFPGHGQTVGITTSSVQETRELPGLQLSVDQFLNKLPQSVVRAGKVLDIRGPIREVLQEAGAKEKLNEIQVESLLVEEVEKRSDQNIAVSTLRIKSENGEYTYKVRMLESETIGDLRVHLSNCRSSHVNSYEIVSRFPHRVYDDESSTLKQLGLVPNAFLLLRAKGSELSGVQNTPGTNAYSQT